MFDKDCTRSPATRLYAAGSIAGEKWAGGAGNETECAAANRIANILDDDGEIWALLNTNDAFTPAERLYFVIAGDDEFNRDRNDAAEFWAFICDDAQPEVEFLAGFATGVHVALLTNIWHPSVLNLETDLSRVHHRL